MRGYTVSYAVGTDDGWPTGHAAPSWIIAPADRTFVGAPLGGRPHRRPRSPPQGAWRALSVDSRERHIMS